MKSMVLVGATILAAAAACAPSVSDGDGKVDAGGGAGGGEADARSGPLNSRLTGTVWAPGNAPGMVPQGEEIPMAGARVYLTTHRPEPIPAGVYCERCVESGEPSAISDARGLFTIEEVFPMQYWLVVEKGQFRRETQITLGPGQTLEAAMDATTLPSKNDHANGMTVPRVAVALGSYDNVENILGKMGLGEVSRHGDFIGGTGEGVVDFYDNAGFRHELEDFALGDVWSLVGSAQKMKQYHIIFFPCTGSDATKLFTQPALRANIEEYVEAGGKFYVADWSAEWEDAVFPEWIKFTPGYDTPPNPGPGDYADADDFDLYTSEESKVLDLGMHDWLDGQRGPISESGRVGTVDAASFEIFDNWVHIAQLPMVSRMDEDGNLISQQATTWVSGDWEDGRGATHPLAVTFEPIGCGRVLYTTFHTTESTHEGLLPQERILIYLITELGACKAGPILR